MKKSLKLSNKDFVHFHVHTSYSSFDGLSQVSDLVNLARKRGHSALAITDHGNVAGWIKFIKECNAKLVDKNGEPIPTIKPILGLEAYLSRNHRWKGKDIAKDVGGYQDDGRKGNRHINLFAMNWKGYQNIAALSEKSWVDGFYHNPRIDIELMAEHSEGVMASSACLGSVVNANLLHGRYEQAKKACALFKDIYGENFFLEVMYHGIPEEGHIIPDIFKLSAEMDIPVCASNDSHYLEKCHGKTQEVIMAMSTSRCLRDPKHIKFPHDEFYLKTAEEMSKIFYHTPEVIFNSVALAERIDSDNIVKNLFGGMRLPKFDIPDEFSSPYEYLVHLAKEGAKKLGWDRSPEHIKTLKKELRDVKVALDVNNYDFATYFLIVRDYIKFAHDNGIVTGPGRGSGYGSLLLRCLGISYGPDPLKYGLIWERFLGFDSKVFVKPSDFGFVYDGKKSRIIEQEEKREYEDDPGGVDRY